MYSYSVNVYISVILRPWRRLTWVYNIDINKTGKSYCPLYIVRNPPRKKFIYLQFPAVVCIFHPVVTVRTQYEDKHQGTVVGHTHLFYTAGYPTADD